MPNTYYRLVRFPDHVRRRDFLSPYDRHRHLDLEATRPCYRRSISLYSDAADSIHFRDLYPNLPQFIAQIKLPGGHGLIEHTPSDVDGQSHHDWWIPNNLDPCQFFRTFVPDGTSDGGHDVP